MAIGLSNNARLGIPRVNQNPRPPGAPHPFKAALANRVAARPRVGVGNNRVAPHPRIGVGPAKAVSAAPPPSTATTTAAPDNTAAAPTPGSTSAAPDPYQQATESQSGTSPFQVPTYTPQAGEADPRDATYWSSLSKLMFNDQQEYAKNLTEQSTADSSYAAAQQAALQARVVQERQLGESTMRTGLVASGWHDRTEAEQAQNFSQERSNAQLTKSQQDQARAAARAALAQGFGIDAAALLAEAAARYAAKQESEAENGAGELSPETQAQGPGPKGPGGKGGGGGGGKGKGQGNGGTTAPSNPRKAAIANRRRAR